MPQENLLAERAEATSIAAQNAEYVVSECDHLRQKHTSVLKQLKDLKLKLSLFVLDKRPIALHRDVRK